MSKHEEWLAAYFSDGDTDALMHFNEKHDAKGRFAKKSGGTSATSSNKPITGVYVAPQGPVPYKLNVSKAEVEKFHANAKVAFMDNCFDLDPANIDDVYASVTTAEEEQTASDNIANAVVKTIESLAYSYIYQSDAYKALRDGQYHSEREWLQGSARLADQVYMDLQMIFGSSKVMDTYLKTAEAKKTVSEAVGYVLGNVYASQNKPSDKIKNQAREKNVTESSGGVKRREAVTMEQLRKENPNLPQAALDAMYKGKTELEKNKKKKSIRGTSSLPNGMQHADYYDETLAHFNPNHDPRNGQFAKSVGAGVSIAASNKKAQIKNAAIRAKRVPDRVAKVKRIGAFTAAGAVTGAGIALGLLSGGFGAMPIAALASSAAAKTGAGLFGAYMGGMLGATAGVGKEAISDYLKGKGADAEDWDRYIRSNTNYDRLL